MISTVDDILHGKEPIIHKCCCGDCNLRKVLINYFYTEHFTSILKNDPGNAAECAPGFNRMKNTFRKVKKRKNRDN